MYTSTESSNCSIQCGWTTHFKSPPDACLFYSLSSSGRLDILIRLPSALCNMTLRQYMQLTSDLTNACVIMP